MNLYPIILTGDTALPLHEMDKVLDHAAQRFRSHALSCQILPQVRLVNEASQVAEVIHVRCVCKG